MPSSEDHIIIWSVEARRTYPDFVVWYSDEKKFVVRSGFGGEEPNF